MPDQYGIPTQDEIDATDAARNARLGHTLTDAQQAAQAGAAAAATITGPPPADQYFEDPTNPLSPYIRNAAIFGNQMAVGAVGIPAAIGRGGYYLTRLADPNLNPNPPSWMQPSVYGPAMTVHGLTPQTPFERDVAAGGRAAGTAASLLPFGAVGAGGVALSALGGGTGEALTQGGYPRLGTAVDVGSALLSGRTPAGLAGGGEEALAAVPREEQQMNELINLERAQRRVGVFGPMLQHYAGAGWGGLISAGLAYGGAGIGALSRMNAAQLTRLAGRVLGGYGVGQTYAGERPSASDASGSLSWRFVPPNVTDTSGLNPMVGQ